MEQVKTTYTNTHFGFKKWCNDSNINIFQNLKFVRNIKRKEYVLIIGVTEKYNLDTLFYRIYMYTQENTFEEITAEDEKKNVLHTYFKTELASFISASSPKIPKERPCLDNTPEFKHWSIRKRLADEDNFKFMRAVKHDQYYIRIGYTVKNDKKILSYRIFEYDKNSKGFTEIADPTSKTDIGKEYFYEYIIRYSKSNFIDMENIEW